MKLSERKQFLIAIAVVLILAVAIVVGAIQFRLWFPQRAKVPTMLGIKVFTDAECTLELANTTLMAWGNVTYGLNNRTYWIKNVGNSNLTLNLEYSGLPANWTLSWDYDGTLLKLLEVRKITFMLTIPSTTPEGTYNWNMWIVADKT